MQEQATDGFIDWIFDWLLDGAGDWIARLMRRQRPGRRARKPRRVRSVTVPSVTGLPAYEARHVLATASLRMKLAGQADGADKVKGIIVEQDPSAGQTVRLRSVVSVRM
jgi:PASTA domain